MKNWLDSEEFYNGKPFPKLDAATGVGETIQNDGKTYYAVCKIPRKVTLLITSWRIISNGIHYYGSLNVDDLNFAKTKKAKTWSLSTTASPLNTRGFKITLRSILKQEDVDKDPQRYHGFHVGRYTHRFNTKSEIKALAKQIFNESFGEGWKLVIDDKS